MNSITIVTICFNNPEDVILTCESVDNQNMYPYEHWIINGSTKADIKNWLENTTQPPYRKWINERDKGIADAFNKGIDHATGDIIYLLNSGDRIYDNTVLQKVTEVFTKDKTIMWCHGKLHLLRGGRWVIVGKSFEKSKLYRGMRSVFHPTMYVRKEVYERRGTYNIKIKIAMDYDFLCRIADEKFEFIDYPLATFDPRGISTSRYMDSIEESFASYQKYYGKTFKQKFWRWRLVFLYFLLTTRIGKWLYKWKVKMKLENK
jgi:glycosyltransferase involved in cell wall biosynthesis